MGKGIFVVGFLLEDMWEYFVCPRILEWTFRMSQKQTRRRKIIASVHVCARLACLRACVFVRGCIFGWVETCMLEIWKAAEGPDICILPGRVPVRSGENVASASWTATLQIISTMCLECMALNLATWICPHWPLNSLTGGRVDFRLETYEAEGSRMSVILTDFYQENCLQVIRVLPAWTKCN